MCPVGVAIGCRWRQRHWLALQIMRVRIDPRATQAVPQEVRATVIAVIETVMHVVRPFTVGAQGQHTQHICADAGDQTLVLISTCLLYSSDAADE